MSFLLDNIYLELEFAFSYDKITLPFLSNFHCGL